MNINKIEKREQREQLLKLREEILQGEQDRLDGAKTFSVSQARKRLRERINDV